MSTDESSYSDLRSHKTPKRRENASKAKYNLRFRHGRNFTHNTPEDRAFFRIDELCQWNHANTHYLSIKNYWKTPPSQQVKHYAISKETLKKNPEGKWKRKFVKFARSENRIRACRCKDYCFMRYTDGAVDAKRQIRFDAEVDYNAWAREDWDTDVAMDLYMEERITQYGWDEEKIPKGDWDGILDKVKTSKKLRRSGPFRLLVADNGEEYVETDEAVELVEGVEWEIVECVGFLSDAESWEDDFDTASCWSV